MTETKHPSWEFSDMLDKILLAAKAKEKHDTALDKYTGYEWGYHGRDERQNMDDAIATAEASVATYLEKQLQEIKSRTEI